MAVRRYAGWMMAAVLAVTLLGACGGSEDDPSIKPMSAAPSSPSATPDAGGLTPEQRALAEKVTDYFTGVIGRGSAPVETVIKDLVTPELLGIVTASEKDNVDDKNLQYLGDVKIDVTKVTINGDTATVEGCNDSSGVFLVKKGETDVSSPSQLLGYFTMSIKLVRQDKRWVIDTPELEAVNRC